MKTKKEPTLLERMGTGEDLAQLVMPVIDWMFEQDVKEITIQKDGDKVKLILDGRKQP